MDGAEGEVGQEDDGIAATYIVLAGTGRNRNHPASFLARSFPLCHYAQSSYGRRPDMASKVAVRCQVRCVSPSDESEDIGPAPTTKLSQPSGCGIGTRLFCCGKPV